MRKFVFILTAVIFFLPIAVKSQNNNIVAKRIYQAPKIDAYLDDEIWKSVEPINDFYQYTPLYDTLPSQKTTVKIAYNDDAVFVAAILYDTDVELIDKQLGARDNSLDADYFMLSIDPYNFRQDAYVFQIFASGVQADWMESDYTYDAIWKSKVRISDSAWIVEMKIPYSAFRFPNKDVHTWGLQIERRIRRNREIDMWALEQKGVDNTKLDWGTLSGVQDIEIPTRLFFYPYISTYVEHFPSDNPNINEFSYNYSGGLDMEYGINESFSLDMTLMPDFSQTKSDDKVKNLSPFETLYGENRAFFSKGMSIFKKGGFFYTRRVGKQPTAYYSVQDSLSEGEDIAYNPDKAKMINAFKFTGKTKKGTTIGLFNAVTVNTYANIVDSTGNQRKILTEPASNYNIFVLEQSLKNNSSIYLINTNKYAGKYFRGGNVSGVGGDIYLDKNKMWNVDFSGGMSNVYNSPEEENTKTGFKYGLSFRKAKGNFLFDVYQNYMDDTFDANDLGTTTTTNYLNNGGSVTYRLLNPYGTFRSANLTFTVFNSLNAQTKKNINTVFTQNYSATFRNYLSVWGYANISPFLRYDYYESRYAGRIYKRPGYYSFHTQMSSDYRHPLAVDVYFTLSANLTDYLGLTYRVSPRVRLNDHIFFRYAFKFIDEKNHVAYVASNNIDSIYFGKRDLTTLVNTFSLTYAIVNSLSMDITLRHYWKKAFNGKYFFLEEDGDLSFDPDYSETYDFNYNAFSIDLSVNWEFAPGSYLKLKYKNNLETNESAVLDFGDNLNYLMDAEALNSLSISILYCLDYQYIKKLF